MLLDFYPAQRAAEAHFRSWRGAVGRVLDVALARFDQLCGRLKGPSTPLLMTGVAEVCVSKAKECRNIAAEPGIAKKTIRMSATIPQEFKSLTHR